MTDIWYDTEFLENGETIELISIGMVNEHGDSFYAVNDGIDNGVLHNRILNSHWLMKNVIPHLPLRKDDNGKPMLKLGTGLGPYFSLDMNSNNIMPLRMIRNNVREFVLSKPDPRLWAWYAAYDHVALCQLFGRMINLPDGFPMFTCDVRQEFERCGNPEMSQEPMLEHHALADAEDCRDKLIWLRNNVDNGIIRHLW